MIEPSDISYVTMTPGFMKPQLGDIVAVVAVDWGMVNSQELADSPAHRIVRGTIYGEVIICTDEQLTIAPQVFDDGGVRCALTMPWVTVEQVTILQRAETR